MAAHAEPLPRRQQTGKLLVTTVRHIYLVKKADDNGLVEVVSLSAVAA